MRRQTVGCRPQFFAVDIGDGDLGTLGEQGLGGAQTEAAGPAGAQRTSRFQSDISQRKSAPLFGQRDLGVVGIGAVEEQRVAQYLH